MLLHRSPLPLAASFGLLLLIQCSALAQDNRLTIARKNYEDAIAAARSEFLSELTAAIKVAQDDGDQATAKKLNEERELFRVEPNTKSNNASKLAMQRLENSVWKTPSNPKGFLRFLKDNQTINHRGARGVWIMSDKNTALTQSGSSGNIYVFRFRADLRSAVVHTFKDDKKPRPYHRR